MHRPVLSSSVYAMATLNAQFCSPEEQTLSSQPDSSLHCLTRNESIVLAFLTQSGALSLFSCLMTFAVILRKIRYYAMTTPGRWRLIKMPMDVYLLSLFAGEGILSMANFLNGKWVQDGKLRIGSWCVAQSVTLSIGSITTAFTMLAVAVHTFMMVWCNKGFYAIRVAYFATSFPWIYSIIYLVIIGNLYGKESDNIFRPDAYWCWIGNKYKIHRIFGGHLWLWSSLITSLALYIPLFFWSRGIITVGNRFWRFKVHRRRVINDPDGMRQEAFSMIIYPIVFGLQIVPLSIGRWIGFVQESRGERTVHVPASALLAVQMVYCLSGMVNAGLLVVKRPNLLLLPKETDSVYECAAEKLPMCDAEAHDGQD